MSPALPAASDAFAGKSEKEHRADKDGGQVATFLVHLYTTSPRSSFSLFSARHLRVDPPGRPSHGSNTSSRSALPWIYRSGGMVGRASTMKGPVMALDRMAVTFMVTETEGTRRHRLDETRFDFRD